MFEAMDSSGSVLQLLMSHRGWFPLKNGPPTPPPPQAHLQQNNWSPGPNIAAIPGPILGMVFIESVNKSCPGMMLGHHVSPCTECIHSISEGTWSQLSQSTCTCELAYGCMLLDTSFTWAELKESPALQF